MLSTNNSIHISEVKFHHSCPGDSSLRTICTKNRSRGFRIALTLMCGARHAGSSAARPMAARWQSGGANQGRPRQAAWRQDTRQHIVSPHPGLSLHATGEAGRIRYLSLRCRQLEMTPVVWCRNPIVFPGRISLPATRRGRASLPSRVHLRRRYLKEYTLALCPRLRL